jgi:hypothetical protein
MTQDQKTAKPPAASAPNAGARRFLAQLMEYCFREGWRTPDHFIKHFPAPAIMAALKSAPELRVAILVAATGIYEEILRRKSPALAAEDLSLALEEGTTSSLQLLAVFTPEDRVRYLDPRRIWDFLAEDLFWRFDPEASDEQRQGAADRMSFTLTTAVQERLITVRDILEGLTYESVADSLSPTELRSVVRHALLRGRDGIGLNEKVLLEVLPLDKLVRSMPLEHIWTEVILRRLAVPCGLTEMAREEQRDKPSERPRSEPRWSSRPSGAPPPLPPELARTPSSLSEPRSVQAAYYPPEPVTGAHEPPAAYPPLVAGVRDYTEDDNELTMGAPSVSGRDGSLLPPPLHSTPPSSPGLRGPLTDDFNHPIAAPPPQSPPMPMSSRPGFSRLPDGPSSGGGEEAENMDRQRQRVTEHLRAIGRLPPRHATMPASVLRSIDAMYALLPSATDDIQRKSVMRQAFANESYLRVALLGLIELMDSSVDTSDPVIQEAKIDALIKILLFEEQRRKENGRFPAAPFQAPFPGTPMGGPRRSSNPPPPSSASSAYYFPPQAPASGGYAGAPNVGSPRPPPPVLANGGYPSSAPPLPNLPAEPRRRTKPPPLPPSYPRG